MPIEKKQLKQYVDQLADGAVVLVQYDANYFYVGSLEISDSGDLIIHCEDEDEIEE